MHFKIKFGLSALAVASLNLTVAFAAVNPTTVKPNYSLSSVAASSMPVANAQEIRSLHSAYSLHAASKHKVLASSRVSVVHAAVSKKAHQQSITVQAGDTLWDIARTYGVSVADLEAWNHLSSSTLHIGQKLVVSGPAVHATLSSRDGSSNASVSNAVEGVLIAQYAANFLGVPYSWGGTSPSGFDCSGFVRYVFAHFGISLERTSFDQSQEGESVSESDLQAGDLLFFASDGEGASHVGIYVGNGEFINAQDSGVRYSYLSESYWAGSYVGARRIVS